MRHDDPPAASTRGRTVIDILEPHDVVLAEIASDLHRDQLQQGLAGIGEAGRTSPDPAYFEQDVALAEAYSDSAGSVCVGLSSQCGGDWHKEAAGFTRYQRKPIGPVERRGAIVFGVDDDCESPNAQAIGADRGIEDQGSAQSLPLVFDGDGEPADEHGGHQRIARQAPGQIGR
jgi:hypothetical protein